MRKPQRGQKPDFSTITDINAVSEPALSHPEDLSPALVEKQLEVLSRAYDLITQIRSITAAYQGTDDDALQLMIANDNWFYQSHMYLPENFENKWVNLRDGLRKAVSLGQRLPDTPLGQKDARFRSGNLLFCFRSLDIIGIVDREKNEVVWAWGLGIIDGPHQPTMLDNGNILLYDNGTYRDTSIAREIDPVSGDIVWQYEDGADFYSPYRSGVQRLPNGNTLICESDAGRIFEVTQDKEIVWDYYSPFLGQGPQNQGRHVYRATRLTADELKPLFDVRESDFVGVGDENRNRLMDFRDVLNYYEDGFRFSTEG